MLETYSDVTVEPTVAAKAEFIKSLGFISQVWLVPFMIVSLLKKVNGVGRGTALLIN